MTLTPPDTTEYNPFYSTYVDKVPAGDILQILASHLGEPRVLAERALALDPARGDHRYAPGKWSLKEVFGHVIDTERLFSHRTLAISRDPATPQPGMDQELWAAGGGHAERTLDDLATEWESARAATLTLAESLTPAQLAARGQASGFEITPKALLWILAGHWIHHRGVIEERYLGS